ncbi:hypothetical protein ACF1HU_01100 [Streptomyces olivaceus]|uniref:hypothetical protein n=1 Tax=Streptomyces olivaceus TaxID=47716 RepID=UPI0036FB4CA5
MNVPELLPLATGTATLVGAGVAGVVAHLTTSRTALTTWRAKTAEWQYEVLTAFYKVALDVRETPFPGGRDRDRLIAAWRRLELTGPEHLVALAKTLYEAARELACRDGLRWWRDFVEEKIGAQQSALAHQVVSQEIPDLQLEDAESAASSLYLLLHDVHAGVKKDWAEVRKAADAYDEAERRRLGTDDELGGMWHSISALLRSTGDPHEVQRGCAAAQLRFDGAVGAFTSGVREWLNGRNPEAS